MDTHHFPDEIVEEILSRLPVKSLLRFKCVSKSYLSLILSDRFIKRHLEKSNSRRRLDRWQVIFGNSKIPNLNRCSLLSYLDDPFVTPLHIDDPITDHLTVDTQIIGHSNGLLCIFNKPNSFFLWNPATRFSLQLPKPDGDYVVKCGFGWDGQCDAYKVFAVLSKRNGNGNGIKRIGSIYNSKTNSWKALEREHEHGSLDLFKWLGVCVQGTIHWIVRMEYIETFDLKSEVFGRIEFPGGVINLGILLDVGIKGRLSLVCDDYDNAVRTVWEMEMDGVEESWVVVSSCLINRGVEESTHMAWTIQKGKLTCSPRVNVVNCDYKRLYIESLVQPFSDNNDA